MYTAFLAVAQACGTPGMLAALALGQVSNLMGCLTTYGIGSAPPYFGAGYVPQGDWLRVRSGPGLLIVLLCCLGGPLVVTSGSGGAIEGTGCRPSVLLWTY
jgi:di/tricarboxylate transporter